MQEARFYTQMPEQKTQCELCPWMCQLKPGQTGICKVRTNEDGILKSAVFNKVAALGSDPIEKKPLYHFFPGKNILSIGEVGCNLQCTFCQNHTISQCYASEFSGFLEISADQIVEEAVSTWNNIGIAFTYNEPFTFFEFMEVIAKKSHAIKMKNVVVSNGYVNQEPLDALLPYIDAFNIDLKAFSNEFYQKFTKAKISPVLDSLKSIAKSNSHLEITNLLIPGLNDDKMIFEDMIHWISSELGKDTPLHLSRYFPSYKLDLKPTPPDLLVKFYGLAKKHLNHVYLGNVSDPARSASYCSNCDNILVERDNYRARTVGITPKNTCKTCGKPSPMLINSP